MDKNFDVLFRCLHVTDIGLGYVATMTNLKTLSLRWCPQIRDFGLQTICSMRSLKNLSVAGQFNYNLIHYQINIKLSFQVVLNWLSMAFHVLSNYNNWMNWNWPTVQVQVKNWLSIWRIICQTTQWSSHELHQVIRSSCHHKIVTILTP